MTINKESSQQFEGSWRELPEYKSDFLTSFDLENGKDYNLTIEKLTYEKTENVSKKMLYVWFFKGTKPLGLNKTNLKSITHITGTNRVESWIGKTITIYKTSVKAFGGDQPCIRVKPPQQQ